MNERLFTRELKNSLTLSGWWVYRIPDVPSEAVYKTPKKPFDIAAMRPGGQFVAIECKQIKEWKAFNYNQLADHQKANLLEVAEKGGLGLVALNVRIPNETNKLLFFGIHTLKEKQSYYADELRTLIGHIGRAGIFPLTKWEPKSPRFS